MIKVCPVCGCTFDANRKDQIYCSDRCRKLKSKSWSKEQIDIDDYSTHNIYLSEADRKDIPTQREIAYVIEILYDFGVQNLTSVPHFQSRIELFAWKNRLLNQVFT